MRLTLLSVEEKVSGEMCEGEQHWACFYAGSRGAGQPLHMTALCSKQLLHATSSPVMRQGMFSFPQCSLFHVLLLRTCPCDLVVSFYVGEIEAKALVLMAHAIACRRCVQSIGEVGCHQCGHPVALLLCGLETRIAEGSWFRRNPVRLFCALEVCGA